MTVVILHNPLSGSGKAQRRADHAAHAFAQAGIEVARHIVGTGEPVTASTLEGARALVVVGGDGTVLRAAGAAMDARCPLYHFPTGNENLFARAFGMTPDPAHLLGALEASDIAHPAVGSLSAGADSHPFLIMCSIGPDAGVIRRLTAVRTRATGHAAYLRPVIAEAFAPLLPRLTIEADGRRLTDARTGWVIVANARQYALRLDPVPDADPFDERLDLVFIPATTALGSVAALLRARARPRRWLRTRAAHIRITAEASAPPCCQVDGELGPADPARLTIDLALDARRLPILRPCR